MAATPDKQQVRPSKLAMIGRNWCNGEFERRNAVKVAPGARTSCPIARTVEIIGDRWTFLILRNLAQSGPAKFSDFLQSLAGISPNTLSLRLKVLEQHGIVERRFYDDHPPRANYLLTEAGRELRPLLKIMKEWGERHTRP